MVRAASDARSPALLLLKGQYQSLGKEATSIAQQYNRQLRLIHAGAAAMTALLTLLSSDKMKSLASFGASAPAIWQTAAFCLSSFIFYLLWRVAENRYEMISASLGLTLCERKINHILGESVLIWNSEIIPRIWSTRGFGTGIGPKFPPHDAESEKRLTLFGILWGRAGTRRSRHQRLSQLLLQ